MAQKSKYFKMPENPFEIFDCCDLNTQTPKSSTRAQKKLFACSFDEQEQEATWSKVFVHKHFCSVITQGLTTPPAMKLLTKQPPAPTKSRKFVNKTDLKPKKLVFKDVEEPESDTVSLSIFRVHSDENIPRKKVLASERDVADDKRLKGNGRKIINDDKENCIGFLHGKSKTNLIKASNALSLSQRQNMNVKSGTKHFRV